MATDPDDMNTTRPMEQAEYDAQVKAEWERIKEANKHPQVGMGATLYYFTDRHAVTVIWVSPSGHQVKVQEDSWKRLDHNGMSESQLYDFCRNDAGIIHLCTRRADGHYRVKGRSAHVEFGYRSMYRDFSF